jgi:hypothetical protein
MVKPKLNRIGPRPRGRLIHEFFQYQVLLAA